MDDFTLKEEFLAYSRLFEQHDINPRRMRPFAISRQEAHDFVQQVGSLMEIPENGSEVDLMGIRCVIVPCDISR